MQNDVNYGNNLFKIKCTECGDDIAKGQTPREMLEDLFKQLSRHKHNIENNLCEQAKDEISFEDMRVGFSREQLKLMAAQSFEVKATEWADADEMMDERLK